MQANTYELKKVLMPERRYVIPTFQRDYEWTRDGQWQLLFEDLETVSDKLWTARSRASADGSSQAKADKSVAPHFLGAIVCDQLPAPAGGLDLRAVIDGQQRLTTLQLLVRGVLDVLIERGSSRVRQIRRLIENPADMIDEPTDRYKLWPRRKDRDVWPVAMADEHCPTKGHLYYEARHFFAARASEAMTADGGGDRTDAVVDALLDLFKLVVIDLEENDDAQVIFEVLNGRQTPLSASDLVKNLLFLRGELSDEKQLEDLYRRYWAEFDEDWWKTTVGTGHAARGRRDVLLSVWLTAVEGEEANVGHLYKRVRGYLDESGRPTRDVLKELHEYAIAYKAVYGIGDVESTVLKTAYSRFASSNMLTVVPLLVWLRTLPLDAFLPYDHERAVAAIESWTMRRTVIGANTRPYGKVFLEVLRAAKTAESTDGSIADAIVTSLLAAPQNQHWPSDDDIRTAFTTNQYYNYFTQAGIRLILGTVDERMRAENPHAEPGTFDYQKLQIEHVMPQKWEQHWPLLTSGSEAEDYVARQQRGVAINRLGNLTLVTGSFNGSLSNNSWAMKGPAIRKQSMLQLNQAFASVDDWNEAQIDARGAALAQVVCRVWPRPT